jgi:hypothetical protein
MDDLTSSSDRSAGEAEITLEVRHVAKMPLAKYLSDFWDKYRLRQAATRQVGREINDQDELTILEVERTCIRDDIYQASLG